jgi:hypothetical protein
MQLLRFGVNRKPLRYHLGARPQRRAICSIKKCIFSLRKTYPSTIPYKRSSCQHALLVIRAVAKSLSVRVRGRRPPRIFSCGGGGGGGGPRGRPPHPRGGPGGPPPPPPRPTKKGLQQPYASDAAWLVYLWYSSGEPSCAFAPELPAQPDHLAPDSDQAVRDCYPTCSYISFVAPGRRPIFDWLPLAAMMLLSNSYAKDIRDDDPHY